MSSALNKFQIVIPMSGFGERFRRAGYTVPKPLIEIEGKPIIAHIVDMFPGESDFVFICNQEHLDCEQYRMEEILSEYCPSGRIVAVPPHKLGPVYAVQQVYDHIDDGRPVVVNYCDFTCYWDWLHFKSFVRKTACKGAIPAYRGFHPHTLGTTNYAYMKEDNGWVEDIQEKQPYTDNRMEEYASSGTYYFDSGLTMKNAFDETIEQELMVGGEYYVSLAYKPLLASHAPIAVYELQHFMQWGTPQDVAEYNHWSETFRCLNEEAKSSPASGSVVLPMAGLGMRFANEGYKKTKPLIPISGKPMVLQAVQDLPSARNHIFILREDMPEYEAISQQIMDAYPDAKLITLDTVSEGQACTANLGVQAIKGDLAEEWITIGACDNGMLFQPEKLNELIANQQADVIVWAVRGHANAIRAPEMFGWVDAEKDGRVRCISVKKPLSNPENDPIVIGAFSFKNKDVFERCYGSLMEREGRVNGEYYLDSCINDALDAEYQCHIFEVDSFMSWGTPNDLKTFEYWQSCFHKWEGHPYQIHCDRRVDASSYDQLCLRYKKTTPEIPKC